MPKATVDNVGMRPALAHPGAVRQDGSQRFLEALSQGPATVWRSL